MFVYECGGMGWSGAAIGWNSLTHSEEHYLSSSSNSHDIGCLYSDSYTAIVYRIDSGKLVLIHNSLLLVSACSKVFVRFFEVLLRFHEHPVLVPHMV